MTVEQLIAQAHDHVPDGDGDEPYWNAVVELHKRNDEETYTAAVALCRDDDFDRRALGVDILSQLGYSLNEEDRAFRQPSIELLLELIETEPHPHVLASICAAFGHLRDPRAIAPLVALATHHDQYVRRDVVFGLLGHDDDRAVDALVTLTEDPIDGTRDWATFGLGTILDRDTPQVREALVARVEDEHPDTRGEAIVGLAKRGDPRGLAPLIEDHEDGWEGKLLDEAGEFYVEAGLLDAWPPPR